MGVNPQSGIDKKEVLKLLNVSKTYKDCEEVIVRSSFTLQQGEIVSLVGPSGCGKTTFLQICGLLDVPTVGDVFVCGEHIKHSKQRTEIRRNCIGFVFQFHHLLPEFSALENVLIPSLIEGRNKKDVAVALLCELGLGSKINNRPHQLSGGEKQRVAIARAVINNPSIILADEPTGNLDRENATNVFDLLLKTAKASNAALLMVTHNLDLAKQTEKTMKIENKYVTIPVPNYPQN